MNYMRPLTRYEPRKWPQIVSRSGKSLVASNRNREFYVLTKSLRGFIVGLVGNVFNLCCLTRGGLWNFSILGKIG